MYKKFVLLLLSLFVLTTCAFAVDSKVAGNFGVIAQKGFNTEFAYGTSVNVDYSLPLINNDLIQGTLWYSDKFGVDESGNELTALSVYPVYEENLYQNADSTFKLTASGGMGYWQGVVTNGSDVKAVSEKLGVQMKWKFINLGLHCARIELNGPDMYVPFAHFVINFK